MKYARIWGLDFELIFSVKTQYPMNIRILQTAYPWYCKFIFLSFCISLGWFALCSTGSILHAPHI